MKLKKIASLMLAGIMAVSMLAGCKSGTTTDDGNTDVKPVDSSFAAKINDELDDNQKAIVTFKADSTLESALNKAAGMLDVDNLKVDTTSWLGDGNVRKSFTEMVDADGNTFKDVFENNDEDQTGAAILVVPGNLTEKGMTEAVVDKLDDLIKTDVLPNGYNGTKYYKYTYEGKIAVAKVDSNDGKVSAYVVGIVIDQTATEIAS